MRARSPLTQTRCTVNTEGLFGKRGEVEGINAEKMVPTKSEGKVNMKGEAEGQGTVFGPLESATSNTPIVAQKFEVARVAPTMLANETEGALSGPGDIRATWPHALFFLCVSRCSAPIRPLFQAHNRCYYRVLLFTAHRARIL